MYLDVSDGNINTLEALLTSPRPSYIRSADVRHLSAAEEDEAHKNHENVVQEVISYIHLVNEIRSLAFISIIGGHGLFKMHILHQ
jgi:hypothetical protein